MYQALEILVIRGITDNSNATGQCALTSDVFQATVTSFRIPRGMKAKIWARSGVAAAQATQFLIEYAPDGSTYRELDRMYVAATAQDTVGLERRKPLVVRSLDGDETFRISWSQGSAGLAYVTIVVEFCDMDDDD